MAEEITNDLDSGLADPPKSVIHSAGKFLTIINTDGSPLQINARHKQYEKAVKALEQEDWPTLYRIMRPADAIQARKWQGEGVTIEGDELFFQGKRIDAVIVDVIFKLIDDGKDPLPIVKFLTRVYKMPEMYEGFEGSKSDYEKAVKAFAESREALFAFIERGGLHFTDRGTVLGYKSVRGVGTQKNGEEVEPLSDWHSGTCRNYIGEVMTLDPRQCDPSRLQSCSTGFHIGNWNYARTFNTNGGDGSYVILLCEFEPEHVIAVPNEGRGEKLRVFRYVPVEIYTDSDALGKDPLPGTVYMSKMFDNTGLWDIIGEETPPGTLVGIGEDE